MKKILFSLGMIVAVGGAVIGGTSAFFSDTETAAGNVFQAGAIDLEIDNESYYNGAFNQGTSWELKSLEEGEDFFFNFDDLKPDDEGEDTISIHVSTNDAWACMQVSVNEFNDNGCNEPEVGAGDATCGTPGAGEGELQNEVNFVWWADDGDNVLETDEVASIFEQTSLASLEINVPLADASGDGILSEGPLNGGETYYVGKAWCYGTLTLDPVPAGQGVNPIVDSGINCDGTGIGNLTQTDSVKGTVSFSAVQSRHNDDFYCVPPEIRPGSVTVTKVVVGGPKVAGDFSLFVGATPVSTGVASQFQPGNYVVSETPDLDYNATFSGGCDAEGDITVPEGGSVGCTITNTYNKVSTLTIVKQLPNNSGGTAVAGDWTYAVTNGFGPVTLNVPTQVTPGSYQVTESGGPAGYTLSYSGDCDSNGNVTVGFNENKTCTLINDDQTVTLTVDKVLTVDTPGISVGDFTLHIVGPNGDQIVSDNVPVTGLPAGSYTVYEVVSGSIPEGVSFTTTFSNACTQVGDNGEVTLAPGENKKCNINNIENAP